MTILVIAPEDSLRLEIGQLLQREGFCVASATDGFDGLQQARDLLPRLIICDVSLPVLDGYSLLQAIRQDPLTAGITLIFFSDDPSPSALRRAMNLGADDYLTTPLNPADLLATTRSRLRKHQLQNVNLADAGVLERLDRDPLTNLLSRTCMERYLSVALEHGRQYQQTTALFLLNIRRFRSINTAFGYQIGDALLCRLTERLKHQLGDHGRVFRTAGDEFAILLEGLFWEQDAMGWAETIQQLWDQPFRIQSEELKIRVSMGGAVTSGAKLSAEQFLMQVDLAHRASQRTESDTCVFYEPSLARQEIEQHLLETDLNRAIAQGEFQVHYQPQISLETGKITGMEALVRWNHPYRGMISPERFITLAEDVGLIIPLGEWVLRTACAQAKCWQSLHRAPLKMSVNLSARQLQQDNLVERVIRILQETDLHPRQLTLELTETQLIPDTAEVIQTLTALRAAGVQIAIDDFGKAYSSLQYLSHLPIDALKIDQFFIQQATIDAQAATISNAIIAMAQDLNLLIIAEGVETAEQLKFLQRSGCYLVQGYLYSPALGAVDMEALLRQDFIDRPS
jgi:diguanylate cyclase (GGDEF)-like protein